MHAEEEEEGRGRVKEQKGRERDPFRTFYVLVFHTELRLDDPMWTSNPRLSVCHARPGGVCSKSVERSV